MAAELKEVEVLETQALSWPAKAKAITISDQTSYDKAAKLLIDIADLEKEITDHHSDPKKKTHAAWKAIVAAEKKLLEPLTEAKGIIKRGLGSWIQEQERIRQEQERKAQEEARRREEEARLALAVEAEKHGASEETKQEILSTALPMQVPVVPSTFQKAKGISGRKYYKWRVVNEKQIPRKYWMLDEKAINGVVRSMGQKADIAGIEIYEEAGITVRR